MSDVRDILELEHPSSGELTKEAFLNTKKRQFEK